VICSFCGLGVELETRACSGCALAGGCRSVCCPRCGYAMPAEPPLVQRVRSWLGRRAEERAGGEGTLAAMQPGERGRVVRIDGRDAGRARKLMALGVVPGAEVELERRGPAVVFWTGYTQLAVDDALAASIVVEPVR
jgi:Fe2+ transport system protein FeoA